MLRTLAIVMRMPFALLAAYALLYFFSYPDYIVPPSAAHEWDEGVTLYTLRHYLWVLPWLATEFFSIIGPRRNLVWFSAMLTVLLGALLAWPVLEATRPELVYPQPEHVAEGGRLAGGLPYFALVLLIGAVVRLVFLRFLFSAPEPDGGSGEVDVDVLTPENARTVQEIAANPVRVQPRFRFGEGDEGVVLRFRALMKRLFLRRCLAKLCLLAALAAGTAWFFLYPQPTEEEALQRDLARMREDYITFKGAKAATPAAVHAAYRVMQYIDRHNSFAGKTKKEAEDWLGLDTEHNRYHALLRAEGDLSLPSVDDTFESRDRFLTVSRALMIPGNGLLAKQLPRGCPTAVLYVRMDESGEHINVVEVQDAGWNDVLDEERHRMGTDWNRGGFFR